MVAALSHMRRALVGIATSSRKPNIRGTARQRAGLGVWRPPADHAPFLHLGRLRVWRTAPGKLTRWVPTRRPAAYQETPGPDETCHGSAARGSSRAGASSESSITISSGRAATGQLDRSPRLADATRSDHVIIRVPSMSPASSASSSSRPRNGLNGTISAAGRDPAASPALFTSPVYPPLGDRWRRPAKRLHGFPEPHNPNVTIRTSPLTSWRRRRLVPRRNSSPHSSPPETRLDRGGRPVLVIERSRSSPPFR